MLSLMIGLTMAASGVTVAPAAAQARKELCLVCAVKHGEAHEEAVKAVRTHEGKEYGFCSEPCAKAFAADPAAYVPPTLPRPAPEFSLKDLSGKPISNETLKGKVVLLDFWATWRAPCRKSMPELEALHRKYAARGLAVVGISIDEAGPAAVKKFITRRKISYPIALDSETSPAWQTYRIKAIPAAYLIDREGRIVAQWTGIPATASEIESKLEALLAKEQE